MTRTAVIAPSSRIATPRILPLPRRAVVAAIFWLAAGIAWLTDEAISASAFPHYNYATNYISDLGIPQIGWFQGRAIDSPLHDVMNATFVGQGVLFAVAGVIAAVIFHARAPKASVAVGIVAVLHGVGLTLVGVFHGSQVNADNGLIVFHITGAATAIIGGNVIAILAGVNSGKLGAPRAYRVVSLVLGILGLISLIMLEVDSSSTSLNIFPDGVWERGSVYSVLAWEVLTGVMLLVGFARRRAAAAAAAPADLAAATVRA